MRRHYPAAMAVTMVTVLIATAARAQDPSPPRTLDGQPDIQGFWSPADTTQFGLHDIEKGETEEHIKIVQRQQRLKASLVIDPPDGKVPYLPAASVKRQQNLVDHDEPGYYDAATRCYPLGVPRSVLRGGVQIVQTPDYVVILTEHAHMFRVIWLDGRPRVPAAVKLWMGDSRGRWEGNTLVVEVTNQTGLAGIDNTGNFYSEHARIVERWTRTRGDRLRYEATIEDPTVFSRPWTLAFPLGRNGDSGFEPLEHACYEGNRVGDTFAIHGGR